MLQNIRKHLANDFHPQHYWGLLNLYDLLINDSGVPRILGG